MARCLGEIRIAAALRELEEHGFLARIQVRLPSGTVITLTLSYNQPSATRAESEPQTERAPAPPPEPTPPPSTPAVSLLAGLRRGDPRLMLAERAVPPTDVSSTGPSSGVPDTPPQ